MNEDEEAIRRAQELARKRIEQQTDKAKVAKQARDVAKKAAKIKGNGHGKR